MTFVKRSFELIVIAAILLALQAAALYCWFGSWQSAYQWTLGESFSWHSAAGSDDQKMQLHLQNLTGRKVAVLGLTPE
jgi:hypothetical protein